MRVLVIAPHGDDEIIGCGGRIRWHLGNGDEVFVIYVTYGDASPGEYTQIEFTEKRRKEILAATKVLGLKEENLRFMPEIYPVAAGTYPPRIDLGGGYYPLRLNEMRLVNDLIPLIRADKPEVIYIPHDGEFHLDHQVVNRMSKQAIRFSPGPWFRETGSNHEKFQIREIWGYEVDEPIKKPDLISLVCSHEWDKDRWIQKLDALRCHATTQDVVYFEKRMEKRHAELRNLYLKEWDFDHTSENCAFEAFQKVTIWK